MSTDLLRRTTSAADVRYPAESKLTPTIKIHTVEDSLCLCVVSFFYLAETKSDKNWQAGSALTHEPPKCLRVVPFLSEKKSDKGGIFETRKRHSSTKFSLKFCAKGGSFYQLFSSRRRLKIILGKNYTAK